MFDNKNMRLAQFHYLILHKVKKHLKAQFINLFHASDM